jgi:hypothetical protein
VLTLCFGDAHEPKCNAEQASGRAAARNDTDTPGLVHWHGQMIPERCRRRRRGRHAVRALEASKRSEKAMLAVVQEGAPLTGSLVTRRWREQDSNHRSRKKDPIIMADDLPGSVRDEKFESVPLLRRVRDEPGPRRAPPESILWFTCRVVPSGKEAERSQEAAAAVSGGRPSGVLALNARSMELP